MRKVFVFSGKGGVGKTTISSATAVKISEDLQEKTLLISFDIAHNLSDIFETEIGDKITPVSDHLDVIEPDPEHYIKEYSDPIFKLIKKTIYDLAIPKMSPSLKLLIDSMLHSENLPKQAKTAAFFQLFFNASRSKEYEFIFADFPPTGGTINIFEVPKFFVQEIMNNFLSYKTPIVLAYEGVRRALNPTKMLSLSSPLSKLMDHLKKVKKRGDVVNDIIEKHLTLRLVTIPEWAAIQETVRAVQNLAIFHDVDGVYINKIIGNDIINDNEFLKKMRENQLKRIDQIKEMLPNKPYWTLEQETTEPLDFENLYKLANKLYKNITIDEIIEPPNSSD
ncbi:MAG: AAA family ATPase [Candidatus Lokiarchaeota archaeon]|nr:AAA family ATPase [Candidatus Lokiarchaeota archaeon]